ncbi:MAG: hypothetical protein H6Q67_1658 [Firmicutes bacterium]|nr:hypothetical protein [Bacillota bacterium]
MNKQSTLIGILVFILLIFSNAIVLANSITFPEVGTVELPSNIEVSEDPSKNGVMNYNIRVYDNNIWRGATILGCQKVSELEHDFDNTEKIKDSLNKELDKIKNSNSNWTVLQVEPAKQIFRDGKIVYLSGAKVVYPYVAIVTNMDVYFFKTDCVNMVLVASADADAQYWRPIITKMLTNIHS